MKRATTGWFSAAAVSVAVHCAVFGCAAWAIGLKKEYVPTELFRLREAPMIARNVQPALPPPVQTRMPEPPHPKPKPASKPEPMPVEPEPVVETPKPTETPSAKEETPPPPQPETAPPAAVVAQNAPIAPPAESLPPEPAYRETSQLSELPYFRTKVKPSYPRSALRKGKDARVVVEVYINNKGGVDDVRVAQSGGEEFDAAVVAALRQSLFEPGYLAGKPVAVRVLIPFNFRVG